MLCLPDEILYLILSNLYHITEDFRRQGNISDILYCRMVCRRLADVGAYLAFRHVSFGHSENGYRKLLSLSHSGHEDRVRHLSCTFEDFESEFLSKDSFVAFIRRLAGEGGFDKICPKKLEEAHKDHCRGYFRNCAIEESNLDVANLSVILPRFKCLRSISFSQSPDNIPGVGFDSLYYKDVKHSLQLPTGPRVFNSFTTALYASDARLTNLVLRSRDAEGFSMPLTGILRSLSSMRPAIRERVFSALSSLSVELPPYGGPGVAYGDGLLKLIQSAPLLEKLEISLGYGEDRILPAILLDRVTMPKLRIIRVKGGDFSDPSSLMNFVCRHCSTLREVELCRVALRKGSWEHVLPHLKETLGELSLDEDALPGWPGTARRSFHFRS